MGKVSDLAAAVSVGDSDTLYIVQGGVSRKVSVSLLRLNISSLIKPKTVDETVSASIVLQDDNELFFPGVAPGTYALSGLLRVGGNTNVVIAQIGGTATGTYGLLKFDNAGTNEILNNAAIGTNSFAIGNPNVSASVTAVVVVTVSGTLVLRWAQSIAAGSAVMKAGSYLQLTRLF